MSAAQNCPANNICQGNGNCVFNCQQLNCNDNNPCTTDSCNAQQGCVRTNNNNSCSDGNACNGNETCQNGSCQRSAAPNCADTDPCTTDGCNPQNGQCTHTALSCPAGQSCQGGQCTVTQVCAPDSLLSCTGSTQRFCNAAGTGTVDRACPTAMVCDSAGGSANCVSVFTPNPAGPCTGANERVAGCVDATGIACVSTITGTTRRQACPTGNSCLGGTDTAVCIRTPTLPGG